MKRYLTFVILMACAIGSAQNINEALRYGTENLQGTARFQAMGGPITIPIMKHVILVTPT